VIGDYIADHTGSLAACRGVRGALGPEPFATAVPDI
jgi:hypothetical protein